MLDDASSDTPYYVNDVMCNLEQRPRTTLRSRLMLVRADAYQFSLIQRVLLNILRDSSIFFKKFIVHKISFVFMNFFCFNFTCRDIQNYVKRPENRVR